MTMTAALQSAYSLLDSSLMYFQGQPVGTVAALSQAGLAAVNYEECFVRDFVPSALVFLRTGRGDIVRNFLVTVLGLRTRERVVAGHEIVPGVMPASFRVNVCDNGREQLVADFGERAIGRVAPVDSMMWWMLLLSAYAASSGDTQLHRRADFQSGIRQIMHLCLKDSFEVSPGLLVPDAACMIDRRMGIYGHPLEIQALFYGTLRIARSLLAGDDEATRQLRHTIARREQALRSYVRLYYWLDLARLKEIHRYRTEEFGVQIANLFNIYPESIPEWIKEWLPDDGGFLMGNLGPGRMDFRFFALGNLLAVLFDLCTDEQAFSLLKLYEHRWADLVGSVPLKICFPAMEGIEWQLVTGCDPKNAAWSYHNGGNWPVLLWPFVAAAVKTGRGDLAQRALQLAEHRLFRDGWPEYYDGRGGRLIGRRANFGQVWSATAFILASMILEQPDLARSFLGFPYAESG